MNTDQNSIVPTRPIIKLDFSGLPPETAGVTIAAFFTALSVNLMSGDLVQLAMYQALDIAVENGVAPEDAGALLAQISTVMEQGRRRNPLSGMF